MKLRVQLLAGVLVELGLGWPFAAWGALPGSAAPVMPAASDTLERFLAAPDSVVGYTFDYKLGEAGSASQAIRSRCFVNYPAAVRHVLSPEEVAALQGLVRRARDTSTDLDKNFWACCSLPRWGFELFRDGRAGCLKVHVCSCCAGWEFGWHQYGTGGLATEMGPQFEALCSRLFR